MKQSLSSTRGLLVSLAAFVIVALKTDAAVHYVSLNSANPTPPYTNWPTAATNIQDAVAAAATGDTVLVTNGIYGAGETIIYGQETNRVALTNAITLLSVNGPQQTSLLGGTQTRCIYVGNNAVLSGFTLTNGHVRTSAGDVTNELSGAGAWCEIGGTVTNCLIVGNVASVGGRGGGIYGGMVYNSTLKSNVAGFGGAAATASLYNCTLASNSAPYSPPFGYGGAVYQGTLSNCTLIGNGWGYGVSGGGAYQSTLFNCTLLTNTSSYGGGGAFASTLYHCLLSGNQDGGSGGGGTYQCANFNCTLTGNQAGSGAGTYVGTNYNCVVTGNRASYQGGGAYGGTFYNCTVVGNTATNAGGGVYSGICYNCIVYFNTAPSASNYAGGNLQSCCALPIAPGPGNFTNAPIFINFAAADFHQQTNSPSINGGFNTYIASLLNTDLDGNPRIVGGTVDIGAYEYQGSNFGLPIPIPWLRQYGLLSGGSANYLDNDGDGLNNWQEWIAGTTPTDASSTLKVLAPVSTNSAVGIIVSWQSVSNRTYFLQRATNLTNQPAFSTIATNLTGQAGTTTCNDTTATNPGPYFYRVGVE